MYCSYFHKTTHNVYDMNINAQSELANLSKISTITVPLYSRFSCFNFMSLVPVTICLIHYANIFSLILSLSTIRILTR